MRKSNQPVFADADDFAHLLEENADEANLAITSDAMINKDSASKFILPVCSFPCDLVSY